MRKVFSIIIIVIFLLVLSNISIAADAFGVKGGRNTDSQTSNPASAGKINNWPQKAQDMCKKAQDNAIKKCEEFAKGYDPGGWWIDRDISAQTHSGNKYLGKDIDVHIDDWIIGKWDCPPHNLLVDDNGNYIEQLKIYSEHIDYNNYKRKGTDEEDVEIVCSFSCGAWSCPTPQDLNPNSDCTDFEFIDKNNDGKDDKTGKNADNFAKGKVEEKLGIREMCEWKEGCKLYDYSKKLIKGKNEGQYFLRVCGECSCPWLELDSTYDPNAYTPLGYDPFKKLDDADKIPEKMRVSDPEITFNAQIYTLADAIKITVHDDFLNKISDSKEVVGVRISSSSNPNGKIYELAETAPDSGIFTLTSRVKDFINKQGIIALHYTYYNASGHQKILSSSVEVKGAAIAVSQPKPVPAVKKENNQGASFADYKKGASRVNYNLRKGWNMIQAKNWVDLGSCKDKLWGGYIFSPASNQYFGGQVSGNQIGFAKDAAKMKKEASDAAYHHLSNQAGAFVYAYEDCDMTIELHDKPGNFVLGRGWNFFTFQPHMAGKSFGDALGHCRYSDFIAFNAWNPDEQKWFWSQNNYLKGPFSNYEGLDDTAEIEENAVGASYMIYVPKACSLAPLKLNAILTNEELSEEDFEAVVSPDVSISSKSDEEKEKTLNAAKGQYALNKTACIEKERDEKVFVATAKGVCDDNDPKTTDVCYFRTDRQFICRHGWHVKKACTGLTGNTGCDDGDPGSYELCAWHWVAPEKRSCFYWKWGKDCSETATKGLKKYLGSCETASIGAGPTKG